VSRIAAGIPLFFYSLLQVNKPRLDQAIVKAQLGFLYDGYSKKAWCVIPYLSSALSNRCAVSR
jgi:hypothetical protein